MLCASPPVAKENKCSSLTSVALAIPHLGKALHGGSFSFERSPIECRECGSTEPITAERMARSGDGLARSGAGLLREAPLHGREAWYNNAAAQEPHPAPTQGAATSRKSCWRNKLPLGTRKHSSKGDKSSASHTETTSPQIKPPLPGTKVPSRELWKALFLSPVLLVIFNY